MFIDTAIPALFIVLNIIVHVPVLFNVFVYTTSEGRRRRVQQKRTPPERFLGMVLVVLLFLGSFGGSIFLVSNFFKQSQFIPSMALAAFCSYIVLLWAGQNYVLVTKISKYAAIVSMIVTAVEFVVFR